MTIEQIKQKSQLIEDYEFMIRVRDAYKEHVSMIEQTPNLVMGDVSVLRGGEYERIRTSPHFPLYAKWLVAGFTEAIQRLDLEIDKVKKEIETD